MATCHFQSVLDLYSGLVGKTFTGLYEGKVKYHRSDRHKVIVDFGDEIEEVLQRIVDSDEADKVWKGLYKSVPEHGQFVICAYQIASDCMEQEDYFEVPVDKGTRYELEVTNFESFETEMYRGGVNIYLKVIREL